MESPKPRETQSELFEEFSSAQARPERLPGVTRGQKPLLFSTNIEQLLMAGILAILLLCGVFFLGVLRGKSLSGSLIEAAASASETRLAVPAAPVQPVRPAPVPQPVPVQAEPSAPMAQSVASKPYTIQIVTHRKKELAEAEMNGLRAMGFYSFIIPSGEYYQVCVGQYASKEEAKNDLERFQAKFKDCFLRRR